MTELTTLQREFSRLFPEIEVRFWEPMAKHTSFRIGGPAQVMAFPKDERQLGQLLSFAKQQQCPLHILGAGTNVLAPDEGLPGLTVCLKDALEGMEQLDETTVRIAAGVTMARSAMFAAKLGLSGMEFAHGIPGTVGGGVYMNAGAYGGEMKDICIQAEFMDLEGNVRTLSREELDFSYRHSALEEMPGVVLSATFRLEKGEQEAIRARMQELIGKRRASQPLDLPSAGSAFKRPQSGYAAALIDQSGLRGFRVGDAAVSEKHTGFAVNLGCATARDVRTLLSRVAEIVLEKTGVRLEPEVRIW